NPGAPSRPAVPPARPATGAWVAFSAAGGRGASCFPPASGAYSGLVLQRAPAGEQRRRIVASAREIAPLLRDAWTGFGRPDADLRHLARAIRCPVLIAWAARDQVIQLRRCRPALRDFPDARLETFPAGHAPHLETPDAFEAALERFLELLGRAQAPADAARTA